MSKLPVTIAAASMLLVFPALAGQKEGGQPQGGLGGKTYGYERESDMRQYGEREGGRSPRAEFFREGCKYITVRQRRGDEIVIRRFRRCD